MTAGDDEPTSTPPAGAATAEGSAETPDPVEPQPFEVDQIASSPREDVRSALREDHDPAFGPALIEDSKIVSGGPPPDGIPAIDTPKFLDVADVDFLEDNEPVLSLDIDGDVRAYPLQIMTWHELVNDTVGGQPVTISYCPLCNSALAYDRQVGDRILDFGTSGRLYQSSLVMYDRQTESLWTHFDGQAVQGALTGTQLDFFPMPLTSWAEFREAHPDGLVLSRDTGFERQYGANPYVGYEQAAAPIGGFITDDFEETLPAKQRVVGLRSGDDSVAILQEALLDAGVIDIELDGQPVTVWRLPGTSSALGGSSLSDGPDVGSVGAFSPVLDGEQLTFDRDGDGFVDAGTGSTWNIFGEAVEGPLVGSQLDGVEVVDTFWFAWGTFQPETRILPGDGDGDLPEGG